MTSPVKPPASPSPPSSSGRAPGVRFGPFEAHLETRELRRDGRRVKLQGKAFDVLLVLLRNPGGFVTREALERELWPEGTYVDFEHGLNSVVRKLREALGDDAHSPRYVETVPRHGYRFIAPVTVLAAAPAPLDGAPDAASTPEGRPLPRRGLALALTVLVLGIVAAWWPRIERALRPSDTAIRSLAVLPLLDLSAAGDHEYFADGMTESLIAELGRLPDLKVISRTSAMTYKGSSRTLPDIARRLGVDGVVEGSVAIEGDHVRVTAQLIDARSDRHLWAETYERSLDETLALQAELASAIARQVESRLTPQQVARWNSPGRVDRAAQDAYLRGRYFWNQRTREGFAKARESFEAAIAADPGYALAHAGLADTYGLMSIQGYDLVAPQEAMSRARQEAERALELDDSLAEPHASLAWVNFNYDWDFAAAEREFRRAITLNPGYATAHQWYANLLCILGRFDEASVEIGRALELDPLSRVINNEAGWPLGYLGRHEEAVAQYRRAMELDPLYPTPHLPTGLEFEEMGRYEDAIAEYRTFERLSGEGPTAAAYIAHAEAKRGRRDEAQRILRDLEKADKTGYVSPYEYALVYAGLGDREPMFAWFAKALQDRSDFLLYLGVDAAWREYRSDPRFVALLERIGLPVARGVSTAP
jgi:TolB-like protein/DNA-binding winged helix-turn-helix (wHTH) protein/Tfp pilus assembly protein PilF